MNTSASINELSIAEKREGWKLLFDGITKNGWHIYNGISDGSAWKIKDGCLSLDPTETVDRLTVGGGDILTDEEFENFHLKLEWRLNKGGNSGVIFYVKEEQQYERTWHTGPEIQVLDNEGHKDADITTHRCCDLYDLVSSSPDATNPAGEWNSFELVSNKGALQVFMNGTKVLSTNLWDDNFKMLVAKSKFKDMQDFAKYRSGKIALQDHGDPVSYRNIRILRMEN